MRYRKLRIVWSVGWGVLVVLLCVLWVRSSFSGDEWEGHWHDHYWFAYSEGGTIQLTSGADDGTDHPLSIEHWTFPVGEAPEMWVEVNRRVARPGIDHVTGEESDYWVVSCWLPAFVVLVVAVVPWLRWRFSLRTLLIATTLVAVGLGLLVWAAK